MLPLGFNKTFSAGASHTALEFSGVCGTAAIGVTAVSSGVLDGAGVIDGTDVFDGAGVIDGTDVFDGAGVFDGPGVFDGAGVFDGPSVFDGPGVLDDIGLLVGTGVVVVKLLDEDESLELLSEGVAVGAPGQLGTLILVLAAFAVTAVCAKILPLTRVLAPKVIADLLIRVPFKVLFAPSVATFATQNTLQGLAPFIKLTFAAAAVLNAPKILKM
jgi:hypothetical protein